MADADDTACARPAFCPQAISWPSPVNSFAESTPDLMWAFAEGVVSHAGQHQAYIPGCDALHCRNREGSHV